MLFDYDKPEITDNSELTRDTIPAPPPVSEEDIDTLPNIPVASIIE